MGDQVDPELSRKRAEAGRRGAEARWRNRGSNHKLPSPADSWRAGVKAWRAQLPQDAQGLRLENSADDAELYLYDIISGDDWWGGISSNSVVQALKDVTGDSLTVRINSPGGDIFEAHAIYNVLRNHPATINVYIDGIAASAASYIAQVGDTVTMASNASMMIHDVLTITVGNEADHLAQAADLGKQSDIIAKIYADRAGGTLEDWRDAMRAETWYTADEALEAGLATAVSDNSREPANTFDTTPYGDAAKLVALTTSPASPDGDKDPFDGIDFSGVADALKGAFA